MKWVEDPVYAVRNAALDSIKEIGEKFGADWTKIHIFPLIELLATSPIFTKRMTALRAINKLCCLIDYQSCCIFLVTLSNDRIPNIRFNVAKTIQNLSNFFKVQPDLLKILEKMKSDNDADVKFYASEALKKIHE